MSILPHFYIESLSPLYEDVQLQEIFPDSKFFVDCIPVSPPGDIISVYMKEKTLPGFDLRAFVTKHFIFPTEADNSYRSADKPLEQHLNDLWDVLVRTPDQHGGTLIPLPHPYIVPGGRFREIYYWDSYFTMLGLQVSKRVTIIQDMIDNFAYLVDQAGFIPNGNRTYYLGRSQPPFFALMVAILMEEKGKEVLFDYRRQLEKEYRFWMDGADDLSATNPTHRHVVLMQDGSILNRYWDDKDTPRPEAYIEDKHLAENSGKDPSVVYRHIRAAAESGWDFSSRWFRDGKNMATIQTTDLIPVDLNCLLLFLEIMLCTIYEKQDEPALHEMLQKLMRRNKALEHYCWNEEKGFYFDYQFKDQKQSGAYTLAATFPLFFNLASPEQSAKVAICLEEKFLRPGGLVSTLAETGQQWDAPNGWAPLQWIAYKSLKKNGHTELANKIKQNWMQLNEKVYAATGKMMEKYNVSDTATEAGGGEYPNQDGFGWTNGVYLKFMAD
jgi:alpha,alpha-trehalase